MGQIFSESREGDVAEDAAVRHGSEHVVEKVFSLAVNGLCMLEAEHSGYSTQFAIFFCRELPRKVQGVHR